MPVVCTVDNSDDVPVTTFNKFQHESISQPRSRAIASSRFNSGTVNDVASSIMLLSCEALIECILLPQAS
jgi:hypothetical protein